MMVRVRTMLALSAVLLASPLSAQKPDTAQLHAMIDKATATVMPQVVAWRRDIHEHPELGNREFRTSALVAAQLTKLGLSVRTGVGKTGVVGVLAGGKPGPVVALRADMDALPVTEQVDLPFKSTVKTQYNGQEVGVMHACGHDNHVAILLGVATVLAGMKADLPGTVVFIFQPAEEGPPTGEEGGAELMIKEGALQNPAPEAIFGLHVWTNTTGDIDLRPGSLMASAAGLKIVVHGKQTHGAQPWRGVDPIVVAAQIVLGLQTITSRELDLRKGAAVITVGAINGGNRGNIIPDSVVMIGTVRTFVPGMEKQIADLVKRTAEGIAASAGATATTEVEGGYEPTINDPALVAKMLPSLRRVAGSKVDADMTPLTPSEDFSAYAEKIPGMFFFLGVVPPGTDPTTAPPNHSPYFFADEAALPVGVRALASLTVDYLASGGMKKGAVKVSGR
jgi:amidohydrolase